MPNGAHWAERRSPEPRRLFDEDQEGELESFGEANMFEFGCGCPGGEEVAVVERSAEASIGRAAGGHANACSQTAPAPSSLGP